MNSILSIVFKGLSNIFGSQPILFVSHCYKLSDGSRARWKIYSWKIYMKLVAFYIQVCVVFFFQIKKPLIEKQRRKRINDSLQEIKRLVLEALNRDVSLTYNLM